jgi:uncharacterized membrane protein YcaP (DUF421 family)
LTRQGRGRSRLPRPLEAQVWKDIFVPQVPLVESVLRVVLVYALIVVLVRLGGKRGLATMNTLDFVVVFLLAGVVENAIKGDDTSVLGGAVSAVTLIAASRAVRRLVDTSPLAQRMLEGRPTTVIEHGHVVQGALQKLGLRTSELDHAIRSQHGDDLEEIEHGELTPSGRFVLTLKPDEQSSTKADMAALEQRLKRIEAMLSAQR